MRHLILHGEYELTIDDKNRFLIPAEIRKMMNPERDGEAFFLVIGTDRRPWMYPERYYEALVGAQSVPLQRFEVHGDVDGLSE